MKILEALQSVRPGHLLPDSYFDALLEDGVYVSSRRDIVSAERFVSDFSNKQFATEADRQAAVFEALLISELPDVYKLLIETVTGSPAPAGGFSAFFRAPFSQDDLDRISRSLEGFDVKVRLAPGAVDHTHGQVSEVGVLDVTVKGGIEYVVPKTDSASLPQSRSDYRSLKESGGVDDAAFRMLYRVVGASKNGARVCDHNGRVWEYTSTTCTWTPDLTTCNDLAGVPYVQVNGNALQESSHPSDASKPQVLWVYGTSGLRVKTIPPGSKDTHESVFPGWSPRMPYGRVLTLGEGREATLVLPLSESGSDDLCARVAEALVSSGPIRKITVYEVDADVVDGVQNLTGVSLESVRSLFGQGARVEEAAGGRWVTTRTGRRIFINTKGQVTKGNPHLLRHLRASRR